MSALRGPAIGDRAREAIDAANDTDYGLNASVWGPVNQAMEVAGQLNAGSVNINDGYSASWASTSAPMSGWGRSGVGCRHGREGVLSFTKTRTMPASRVWPITPPPAVSNRTWARLMRLFARFK